MNTAIFIVAAFFLIAGVESSQTPSTASPTIVFVCDGEYVDQNLWAIVDEGSESGGPASHVGI